MCMAVAEGVDIALVLIVQFTRQMHASLLLPLCPARLGSVVSTLGSALLPGHPVHVLVVLPCPPTRDATHNNPGETRLTLLPQRASTPLGARAKRAAQGEIPPRPPRPPSGRGAMGLARQRPRRWGTAHTLSKPVHSRIAPNERKIYNIFAGGSGYISNF